MSHGPQRTASVASMFLLLLLLCCKREETSSGTAATAQPQVQPPRDSCGAQGNWRFSCPRTPASDSCSIRSIGAIANTFTIPQSMAESGGTWTVGDTKYTLDKATCVLSGFTSGMPCKDLRFEANLRTGLGHNVYGCWDGSNKCQALWTSAPGHCAVTKI